MRGAGFAAMISVFVLGLGLGGCATIFTGTDDTITFQSEPSGAMVVIDGADRGRTPLTTSVGRNLNSADISYRLDGYETRSFELGQEFNMAAIVSLFCFPICPVVDLLTGAAMEYDPTSYTLELTPREELEEALDVEEVVFEEELHRDALGRPDPAQIRPDIAIVSSHRRQIVIFR